MSDDAIIMPKGGLLDGRGQLTPAGQHYLASLGKRIADKPAGTAAEFLLAGQPIVRSQAVFLTMAATWEDVIGDWYPDLGAKLHFKISMLGPTRIMFPQRVPQQAGGALPFFSVMVKQPAIGGVELTYGDEFAGEAPVILTGGADRTLLGFQVTEASPAEFTGWTVKGIESGI